MKTRPHTNDSLMDRILTCEAARIAACCVLSASECGLSRQDIGRLLPYIVEATNEYIRDVTGDVADQLLLEHVRETGAPSFNPEADEKMLSMEMTLWDNKAGYDYLMMHSHIRDYQDIRDCRTVYTWDIALYEGFGWRRKRLTRFNNAVRNLRQQDLEHKDMGVWVYSQAVELQNKPDPFLKTRLKKDPDYRPAEFATERYVRLMEATGDEIRAGIRKREENKKKFTTAKMDAINKRAAELSLPDVCGSGDAWGRKTATYRKGGETDGTRRTDLSKQHLPR